MRKKSTTRTNAAKTTAAKTTATIKEATTKATVNKTVREVAQKMETKKITETTIELPGCAVTMTAIEEAVKKDMDAKEISGKEINVYINADQKAAYYTVDGEGADNYRIDLTSL